MTNNFDFDFINAFDFDFTQKFQNDFDLDFINELRTVTYKWKAPSELDKSFSSYDKDKTEPSYANKIYGLIAQEVKSAMDKHNITNFDGWGEVGDEKLQSISEAMFVFPLIKAVQ